MCHARLKPADQDTWHHLISPAVVDRTDSHSPGRISLKIADTLIHTLPSSRPRSPCNLRICDTMYQIRRVRGDAAAGLDLANQIADRRYGAKAQFRRGSSFRQPETAHQRQSHDSPVAPATAAKANVRGTQVQHAELFRALAHPLCSPLPIPVVRKDRLLRVPPCQRAPKTSHPRAPKTSHPWAPENQPPNRGGLPGRMVSERSLLRWRTRSTWWRAKTY